MLVGPRDDLATRRPLGHRVCEASVTPHPAVLVVENVDRADEVSLDALRFLVRCMERLPALRPHLPRRRLSHGHPGCAAGRLDPAQVYEVTSGNMMTDEGQDRVPDIVFRLNQYIRPG